MCLEPHNLQIRAQYENHVHLFSFQFPVKPYFWTQEIIFLTSNSKNQIYFSRSSYKWNVTWTLLCLASYALHDSVKFIHVSTCYRWFLFLWSNILLYEYITSVFIYSLFYTHSLLDGYLNCFQVFIIKIGLLWTLMKVRFW